MVNLFREGFDFNLKTGETYGAQYLPKIVNENYIKLINNFHSKDFCLMFDETTDAEGRYILNLFGKVLDNTPRPPVLIDTIKLVKTNSDNILKEVKFILGALIQNRRSKHNFKFLVTDGAAYCLKVGRLLKEEFVEMKHVVCVCHNIHLLAE